jgi:mono/diheme cytochrome c family protein
MVPFGFSDRFAPLAASLLRRGVLLLAVASGLGACSKKSDAPAAPLSPEAEAAQLVQRGRTVYQTNCVACHASDPSRPGPVGPEIAGSSLELLRARVLTKDYPPGYKPKRPTQVMPPLPHLEKEIPALHAFLNQK